MVSECTVAGVCTASGGCRGVNVCTQNEGVRKKSVGLYTAGVVGWWASSK